MMMMMMMMMIVVAGERGRGGDERRANLGDGLDGLGRGVEFFLGGHVVGLGAARDVTRGRHFSTTTMVTTR